MNFKKILSFTVLLSYGAFFEAYADTSSQQTSTLVAQNMRRQAPVQRQAPMPRQQRSFNDSSWARPSVQTHAVGVILLSPTGISYKYSFDEYSAIDAAFAISDRYSFYVHGNYLLREPGFFEVDRFPVELYYGVGTRLINRDSKSIDKDEQTLQIAARAPVGLSVNFNSPDIEIFSELALVANILPKTSVDLTLGLGVRYRF